MESVDLGNAGGGNLAFLRADSVGVVTRWEWPTSSSFVEGVTADQLQAIKNHLYLGDHRESSQSNDWAGYVVAKLLGIELCDKGEKARVAKMIDTSVSQGHLERYRKNDESRRPREFIRTASHSAPPAPPGGGALVVQV